MEDNRDVFSAVADPTRRQILDLLTQNPELALHELTSHFDVGRSAVSKHLNILKQAGLVTSRKVGRETRFQLNAEAGSDFKFTSEPNEYWDGVITGKVLIVEPLKTLSYTWNSAGEETTITWSLAKISATETDLHFEMDGFSEETKKYPGAIQGAISSWNAFANNLEKLLAK